MTFKKPNIRYVDMCIWIDDNAYKEDCDDTLLYQYLYHIINMLAHKQNFFNRSQYYDDFALSTATRTFLRLKSPKQYELKQDGEPKLKKIKSILNYLKNTIYPMKVDFEQDTYSQAYVHDADNDEICEHDFRRLLEKSVDDLNIVDFRVYLRDITKTSRNFISRIPYKTNSAKWNNIYLSCLLTFLNSITLDRKSIEKLKSAKETLHPALLEKLYKEEQKDSLLTYHLEPSMNNYIEVLVRELKHVIAKDLSETLHTYIPSQISIQNIIDGCQDDDFSKDLQE